VLGSGAVVGDHLPGRTVLGCHNVIGHHAVIGVKCQDLKYKVHFPANFLISFVTKIIFVKQYSLFMKHFSRHLVIFNFFYLGLLFLCIHLSFVSSYDYGYACILHYMYKL
jgi:hypothetical protein